MGGEPREASEEGSEVGGKTRKGERVNVGSWAPCPGLCDECGQRWGPGRCPVSTFLSLLVEGHPCGQRKSSAVARGQQVSEGCGSQAW